MNPYRRTVDEDEKASVVVVVVVVVAVTAAAAAIDAEVETFAVAADYSASLGRYTLAARRRGFPNSNRASSLRGQSG